MEHNSKIIAITGAGRVLGYSLTEQFLKKEHMVFVFLRAENPNIIKLKEEYKDKIIILKMDVTKELEIKKAFKQLSSMSENIDILINNAAVHLESLDRN